MTYDEKLNATLSAIGMGGNHLSKTEIEKRLIEKIDSVELDGILIRLEKDGYVEHPATFGWRGLLRANEFLQVGGYVEQTRRKEEAYTMSKRAIKISEKANRIAICGIIIAFVFGLIACVLSAIAIHLSIK